MSVLIRSLVWSALIFAEAAPALGQSQQRYTVHSVGLTDAEHTSPLSERESNTSAVSAAGVAIGGSRRYRGGGDAGYSAWVWDAAHGSTRIGLIDAEHTDGDYQSSSAQRVSSTGRVIGISERPQELGQSAWTWTRELGTTPIGLTGPAYTSSAGVQYSETAGVNAAGAVIGASRTYAGADQSGSSAWVWTPADGHRMLGLDPAPPAPGVPPLNSTLAINDGGQVLGHTSFQVDGEVLLGMSWIWRESAGTTPVGLTDAAHTRADGRRVSFAQAMDADGNVVGGANRYDQATDLGIDAWIWSPGAGLTVINPTSPDYTNAAGQRIALPQAVNNGRAAGMALLVNSAFHGQSAWFWSASTGTIVIGPTDGLYTSSDGRRYSNVTAINANGLVLGYSYRFAGTGTQVLDTVPWVYDPATGATHLLLFSVSPSTGGGWTVPSALLDDGTVLGTYNEYSDTGSGGWHGFTWRADTGMVPLDSLVSGGLPQFSGLTITSFPLQISDRFIAGSAYGANGREALVFVKQRCAADLASLGGNPTPDGQLTPDDLIAFLTAFFSNNLAIADLASLGGDPTPDGQLTPDDLIAFLTAFFAGCP